MPRSTVDDPPALDLGARPTINSGLNGILAAWYLPEGLRGLVAVPRCGDKATHRADRSADRGTKSCTVPTGRGSPDRSPAAGTDQAAPIVLWTGSYGLVQPDRPNMSPTATTQGVIRGLIIALFSSLYSVILSGHERRAIDLHSERTVNYDAT